MENKVIMQSSLSIKIVKIINNHRILTEDYQNFKNKSSDRDLTNNKDFLSFYYFNKGFSRKLMTLKNKLEVHLLISTLINNCNVFEIT